MIKLPKRYVPIALIVIVWVSACWHETHNSTTLDLAQRVTTIVANRHVFQLDPNAVVGHFNDIVQLKSTEVSPYLWIFRGANHKIGVNWVQAEFQPHESVHTENWELLQIRVALKPLDDDYKSLYNVLVAKITSSLGQEPVTGINADKHRAWNVMPYWEISIHNGEFGNPINDRADRLILVEVAVLQGE